MVKPTCGGAVGEMSVPHGLRAEEAMDIRDRIVAVNDQTVSHTNWPAVGDGQHIRTTNHLKETNGQLEMTIIERQRGMTMTLMITTTL